MCYLMSNLRWPGSRSRGRSRYFWITCTWPWLSMKSRSSAASEEMRMPSPTGQNPNRNQSSSFQGEKLSKSQKGSTDSRRKLTGSFYGPVPLFFLHLFIPPNHYTPCVTRAPGLSIQHFLNRGLQSLSRQVPTMTFHCHRHSKYLSTLTKCHTTIGHWLPQ